MFSKCVKDFLLIIENFIYFLVPGDDASHKIHSWIEPFWKYSEEMVVSEPTNKNFSYYKMFLDSLPISNDHVMENVDKDDLIDFKEFCNAEPSEESGLYNFHEALIKAAVTSFTNGAAKEFGKFLLHLFMVNSFQSPLLISTDRECSLDGFLLDRTHFGKSSRSNSSFSNSSDSESYFLRSTKSPTTCQPNRKMHYNTGHQKADIVCRKEYAGGKKKETYCVVEFKSRYSTPDFREAIAQTLSYGFSTRSANQLTCELDLFIITPRTWCHLVLPPYTKTNYIW